MQKASFFFSVCFRIDQAALKMRRLAAAANEGKILTDEKTFSFFVQVTLCLNLNIADESVQLAICVPPAL